MARRRRGAAAGAAAAPRGGAPQEAQQQQQQQARPTAPASQRQRASALRDTDANAAGAVAKQASKPPRERRQRGRQTRRQGQDQSQHRGQEQEQEQEQQGDETVQEAQLQSAADELAALAVELEAKEAKLAHWRALKEAQRLRQSARAEGAGGGSERQPSAPAANVGGSDDGGGEGSDGGASGDDAGAPHEATPQRLGRATPLAAAPGAFAAGSVPETDEKERPAGAGHAGLSQSQQREPPPPRVSLDVLGPQEDGVLPREVAGTPLGVEPEVRAPAAAGSDAASGVEPDSSWHLRAEMDLGGQLLSLSTFGGAGEACREGGAPKLAALVQAEGGECALAVWVPEAGAAVAVRCERPPEIGLPPGAGARRQMLAGCGRSLVASCVGPWGGEEGEGGEPECVHLFEIAGEGSCAMALRHSTRRLRIDPARMRGRPRCVLALPGIGVLAGGDGGAAVLWAEEDAAASGGGVGYRADGTYMAAAKYKENALPEVLTLAALPDRDGVVAGCASSGTVILWNVRAAQVVSVSHSPFNGAVSLLPIPARLADAAGVPVRESADPSAFAAAALLRKSSGRLCAAYVWVCAGSIVVAATPVLCEEQDCALALVDSPASSGGEAPAMGLGGAAAARAKNGGGAASRAACFAIAGGGAVVFLEAVAGAQAGFLVRAAEGESQRPPAIRALEWHAPSRCLAVVWADGVARVFRRAHAQAGGEA